MSESIDIFHDTFGSAEDPALLLISGLGTQMTRWPDAFCAALADRGFHIIRFDNRDAGLSTHLHHLPPPDFRTLAETLMAGRMPDVPYTLRDMAQDAITLMNRLGIAKAHVVGRSMGGMIAQIMASDWPDQVLSLTSIMSGTGNSAMPQTDPEIMALMQSPVPDPVVDPDGFLSNRIAFARAISGSASAFDPAVETALVLTDMRRAHDPAGSARQLAAMVTAGDRRDRLKAISTNTLVIHGTEDRMIRPDCGRDTAASISGAKLVLLDGMGHDFPKAHQARIIAEITENAQHTG